MLELDAECGGAAAIMILGLTKKCPRIFNTVSPRHHPAIPRDSI